VLAWALATMVAVPAGAQAWFANDLAAGARKPPIAEDHISYGAHRKAQMAAYSNRHYGEREYRLTDPKVIVLHFTATDSYSAVWSTFDSNSPDLGETPGVCSQYVIEQDGTIDELVPPRIRCRHTIGLNHVAIGVEMVQEAPNGSHAADLAILHRRPQVRSAMHLVAFLHQKFGIPLREVIGHAMANDDRHFRDLEGWVNDHTDWEAQDVRAFRRRLAHRYFHH
jgi:N-acetyl-anhydromuramyl-L-alanine amidase AmpD